jgi:hypothetical protein
MLMTVAPGMPYPALPALTQRLLVCH